MQHVPLFAVAPVLIGPLQALLAILPGLLAALGGLLLSLFKPRAFVGGLRLVWRLKWPLAALALGGAGAVRGAAWFWPAAAAAPVSAGAGDAGPTAWPMFRGGPQRQGASPLTTGPTRGGLNWSHQRGAEGFFSSPAIVGGRVYAASAELSPFSQSGAIYCFDAAAGGVVWKSAPPGYRPTFSSPAIAENCLVCGEGLHETGDARVVCLDLRGGREGQVLWTYATHSHVECTPVIDAGRVFVGAGDDGYYCLRLAPAGAGEEQLLWHVPGTQYPDAETSLAVNEGQVYAGLGLGGRALCVLDAASGRELRRTPTPYPVFGPPCIVGDKLYFGMGNGDYVHTAEEVRTAQLERQRQRGASDDELEKLEMELAPGGAVWCIDLPTGHIDWKFPVDRAVVGAVAAGAETLYFGSQDGHLYALDLNGKLLANWNAGAPLVTSPALTNTHVYCVSSAGVLFGLDRQTLEPVWEFRLGTTPLFLSSPSVADGRIYVGTQSDGFLCVGEPGTPEIEEWPGRLGGPGAAGVLDGSPIADQPRMVWRLPAEGSAITAPLHVTGPPAYYESRLLAPTATPDFTGLACWQLDRPASEAPKLAWRVATRNRVYQSPAAAMTWAFCVDGRPGDALRNLHCLALHGDDAQREIKRVSIASDASGAFVVTGSMVYVQDRAGWLSSFDAREDMRPNWSKPIGHLTHAPCIGEAIIVAAVDQPRVLVALDGLTGDELWRVPLADELRTSPTVGKNVIFLGTAAGLEARSLVSGQPLPGWHVTPGGVSGDFALRPQIAAYINDQAELVVVSRETGVVLSRSPGAMRGGAPLISRNTALFAGPAGLMQLALGRADAEPVAWAAAQGDPSPDSWLILANSRVFWAGSGGLACWGPGP